MMEIQSFFVQMSMNFSELQPLGTVFELYKANQFLCYQSGFL